MTILVFQQFKKIEAPSCRVNLWLMLFTCCWVSYMLRVNMSLNLVAMVPSHVTKPPVENATGRLRSGSGLRSGINASSFEGQQLLNASYEQNEDDDVRQSEVHKRFYHPAPHETYTWDTDQQALILGSFFWSYCVTSLFGGIVAERWSPSKLVFYTTVIAAIATALCPIAAGYLPFLIVCRVVVGATSGFTYPACHSLIARWVPPHEKGKFIAALMGGVLGTVMTWSVSGPLMITIGWPLAGFYIQAIAAFIWALLWWYLIADSPEEHKRISDEEKAYIQDALQANVSNKKVFPPLLKIFGSIPFWAMAVLHYGNIWGLFFVMTAGPRYVSSVLNFNLRSAGAISALPYLARLICAFGFGSLGDLIVKKQWMRTVMIRKVFSIFSHILPGLLLILMVTLSKSAMVSVMLITLSMGSNGSATLTNLQNHQDLSPNFAGTLYGIANCIGSTSGFITPLITAYFTKDGDTAENWAPVFFIGASVYIVTALIFCVFGKASIQPWNTKE